ncbi:protein kinase family protein [Limobrevibacterium gyesilva]|uniref:Protein kinase domain-containing protein n=1 Tax=Limobrevibacterium gyesilva TaxID=2991712 RepID=A0AA42CET1_9PROT|nr:hypothetical protein [Limobrevibacterium gyesilva]MCW3473941.1 hypothetical protein [Limobrevibacterium gyesilva]
MPETSADDAGAGEVLIGGAFAVDVARPLAGAGGGLPAFVAHDRKGGRTGLMAVQVQPDAPARAQALNMLPQTQVDGVLSPLAHGPAPDASGVPAWFVICQAPPGPPLAAAGDAPARPWGEAELLDRLLRPAAHALEQLQACHATHRAIRPDNLFRAGAGEPVMLGSAWAAPPASLQPALYEPPYAAMCLPCGRGDGSIADDVYALGVTLLVLALGRLPMAGLDDAAIIRRKLEMGSFAALAGDERLPPAIADLVRGMLAEDPEHRPPPALLADPATARARRVAARPPRRAQRPLEMGPQAAWTARTLAYALATDPDRGGRLLRSGSVDRWIRRSLGDSQLAARLEEAVRLRATDPDAEDQRADGLLTARAVAALDPLAPLCWRGIAVWPDGLGPAIVAAGTAGGGEAGTEVADALQQVVAAEAVAAWAAARPDRCDPLILRADAHQHRMLQRLRGWGGGMTRLRYTLNPLLACRSRMLDGRMVVRLPELLPALEAAAARQELHGQLPVDREIAAFVAARGELRAEGDLVALAEPPRPEIAAVVALRVLARLQLRLNGEAVPALAAWLAALAAPALAVWRNRDGRERRERALAEAAQTGHLTAMLEVLDDPPARAADERALQEALAAVQRIDAQLAQIAAGGPARADAARRIGQEAVACAGAVALTIATVAAVLG